jgi:polar amino acid transport system substrate-binding protein
VKRVMLVILLVLGLTLAAAACGGDDEAEEATPPAADTSVVPEAPAETGEGTGQPTFTTSEEGVLTVGSDIPFPPFEFREGGELTGFDVELMEEIASRLGLEVKWVDTAFDTIFTQLAAGQFDVVASATTITEERAEQVNFTEPYYLSQQGLTINTEETPNISALEDLKQGDVVAVQKGTTGEIWARENVPEGVDVRSFPEAPDTYTALEAGNVTGVIFDEPSASFEAEARPGLEVAEVIDTGERYGFPVDPANEGLLSAIDGALTDIIEDGTYQTIYEKFLPAGGSVAQTGG